VIADTLHRINAVTADSAPGCGCSSSFGVPPPDRQGPAEMIGRPEMLWGQAFGKTRAREGLDSYVEWFEAGSCAGRG
jgi:hypothetical protein